MAQRDPYAPPPRHKDRSGAVVRVVILATLLAGGALAYAHFSDRLEDSQALAPPAEQTQMAESDAGPSPFPSSAPAETPAATQPDETATN